MRAVLVSTYELGRQPFGLASAATWVRDAGAEVTCADLAVENLTEENVRHADLLAFYVPMHTATRIAIARLPQIVNWNSKAHLCFFGLYAPINEDYLRKLGVQTILGGEFEEGLAALTRRLLKDDVAADANSAGTSGDQAAASSRTPQEAPAISLARQRFRVPDRHVLPVLSKYAKVSTGQGAERVAGYTEATRGCRHLCRHCPIVPVYGGRFRVVQPEVVLADIRQQVSSGAEHITFGDPDFLNGPAHALRVVRALHEEFPAVTYDATIKVEHLRKHRRVLPALKETGCIFITSAVEAVDEETLLRYEKHHTRQDFIDAATELRELGVAFNPTFVTFAPWTTLESYADLLSLLIELGLVDNLAPIQLAIRLLIPQGSRLLELDDVTDLVDEFDPKALAYPWQHPDPRVDELFEAVRERVAAGTSASESRRQIFAAVCGITREALPAGSRWREILPPDPVPVISRFPMREIPAMTEPWYCCAEPTEEQLLGAQSPPV